MKKRLLALMMAAVFAMSLTACGSSGSGSDTESNTAETDSTASEDASAEETADSGEKKVLRVAMECAYAPYNWTQPDDSNGAVPIS